mgnify:CR=1 FL=1
MAQAVANRYARALADVVGRTEDFHRILQDLEDFAVVYRESAELREVLETPAIAVEDKTRVLDAILARLGTSPIAANFLRVLVSNYRIRMLEEVIGAFTDIAHDQMGVARVKVYYAGELSEAEQQALRTRFEEVTKKQIEIEFARQSELLGGIRAQIKSTVYDGSVRGHLQRLRERLMAR